MTGILKKPYILFPLICGALYAPFCGKPLHIDSPVTVYVARQMLLDPLDPPLGAYGNLLAVWNHTGLPESSVFFITPHPPLIPLYIAPFVAFFGENERILNGAMIPFYVAAVLLFFGLCGILAPRLRYQATLLFALCPVVFVNSQNVMADLPLAVFCMGAFYFAFRSSKRSDAFVAGLWAALACLTKFTGGAIVVCLFLFFVMEKRWKNLLLFMAPVLILFGGWMVHNGLVWGKFQLLSSDHEHYLFGDIRYRFERLISYLGATIVLPPIIIAIVSVIKRYRVVTIVASLVAVSWSILLVTHLHYSWWSAGMYALCAAAGIVVLYGSFIPIVKNARWICLILYLLLHCIGGLFLTLYCTRYLLPFVFIPILFISSVIDRYASRKWVWPMVLLASIITSLMLSIGDYQYAWGEKEVAIDLKKRFEDRPLYFQGRLGYLYYMDKAGFSSLPFPGKEPQSGDFVVRNCANNDDASLFRDTASFSLVQEYRYPLFPLRTMTGRAGFYGNDRLPYAWVSEPKDRIFRVYRKK